MAVFMITFLSVSAGFLCAWIVTLILSAGHPYLPAVYATASGIVISFFGAWAVKKSGFRRGAQSGMIGVSACVMYILFLSLIPYLYRTQMYDPGNGSVAGFVEHFREEGVDVDADSGSGRRMVFRFKGPLLWALRFFELIFMSLFAYGGMYFAAKGDRSRWPLYELCRELNFNRRS